ncbi:MAG: succinylglutamate desuccinylase/aspartoacylase family protein [Candidatus Saccharimonas sp.]
MKILIIGATHGNELLGIKLYQRLLRKRSPLLEHITFLIGNPKAYHAKVRYIDSDLNRSYGIDGNSYEQRRAKYIQQYIQLTQPDLVLDMHTTTCIQPNCLIINNTAGDAKRRMLAASHIDTLLQVVPMNDITTLGDNIVGYEIPNQSITPQLLDDIINDLQRYVDNNAQYKAKKLYVMHDKIYKSDVTPEQAATFKNFTIHDLGCVPIMTGESSYKKQTDYLGFKASIVQEIKV